ncbi:hypothetical protein JW916_15410 [Candidatus Sumerlaeota bacterium]|nr:hypothetical protein [Candidatus Sumerlaeota bacterium]
MEPVAQKSQKVLGVLRFLNRRAIGTSYRRSAIYFALAIAAFALFYFLVLAR